MIEFKKACFIRCVFYLFSIPLIFAACSREATYSHNNSTETATSAISIEPIASDYISSTTTQTTTNEIISHAESSNTMENIEKNNTYSYFDEIKDLPTPDSVINEISFINRSEQNGIIIYSYSLHSDKDTANELYHDYQLFLSDHFNVTTDANDIVYVEDNEKLIAAIQTGYDETDGYFMMVSFPS